MTDNMNKEDFVEKLCNIIVKSYDRESLENIVWDMTYDELIRLDWKELRMHAEDFGAD